jgi:hypothetical protein
MISDSYMFILCINQNNDWCCLVAPGIQFFKLTTMNPCGFLGMWAEMVMPTKLFLLRQTIETDTEKKVLSSVI